jgi:hypothetical protein
MPLRFEQYHRVILILVFCLIFEKQNFDISPYFSQYLNSTMDAIPYFLSNSEKVDDYCIIPILLNATSIPFVLQNLSLNWD